MNDAKLIEALSNVSSLELFELSTIIDRLLADPRRVIAVPGNVNLGKVVRFMDCRTRHRPGGCQRTGRKPDTASPSHAGAQARAGGLPAW